MTLPRFTLHHSATSIHFARNRHATRADSRVHHSMREIRFTEAALCLTMDG